MCVVMIFLLLLVLALSVLLTFSLIFSLSPSININSAQNIARVTYRQAFTFLTFLARAIWYGTGTVRPINVPSSILFSCRLNSQLWN